MESTYVPEHNRRFAVAPASGEDVHRRVPARTTLDRVCPLEEARVLSNDGVIRSDPRYFQVARQSGQAPARSTVLVREARDGAIELRYRGRLMRWTEIPAPLKPAVAPATAPVPLAPRAGRSWRPSADHPWRRDTRPAERELALCRAANR